MCHALFLIGMYQKYFIVSAADREVSAYNILDSHTSEAIVRAYFKAGRSLNEVTDLYKKRIQSENDNQAKWELRERFQLCIDAKKDYYKVHWILAIFARIFSNPVAHAEEALNQSMSPSDWLDEGVDMISKMDEMDRREDLFLRKAGCFRL